ADGLPAAFIPEHDRAAAIFALGNGALEAAIVERMVFDAHGETLVGGIIGWALGHRPALEHAIEFDTKIVVETRGVVLLHHETITGRLARTGFPGGLLCLGKVALGLVFLE